MYSGVQQDGLVYILPYSPWPTTRDSEVQTVYVSPYRPLSLEAQDPEEATDERRRQRARKCNHHPSEDREAQKR